MMRLGFIGGGSWPIQIEYLSKITAASQSHPAIDGIVESITCMINGDKLAAPELDDQWEPVVTALKEAADTLQYGAVDGIVISCNTWHNFVDQLASDLSVPIIDIATPVINRLQAMGVNRVGLVGTKTVMSPDGYMARRLADAGIEAVFPDSAADRAWINDIIYHDFASDHCDIAALRPNYQRIIADMARMNVGAVIEACTDFSFFGLSKETALVPLLDSAALHIDYAGQWALTNNSAPTARAHI